MIRLLLTLLLAGCVTVPNDIRTVNAEANSIPYRSDMAAYGVAQHLATPAEFRAKGGDCEDYAYYKLTQLRMLGYSGNLLIVRTRKGEVHAVAVIDQEGQRLVLDNRRDEVVTLEEMTEYYEIVKEINI